jgi:hypothetical protein
MSTASITAAAVLELAKDCKDSILFASGILKLVSVRISELATHPSVDMVELRAVADELDASVAELTASIPKV